MRVCPGCKKNKRMYVCSITCTSCSIEISRRIIGRAVSIVHAAIREGKLKEIDEKTKCTDCDYPAEDYDHRDYFKPLDVVPVCKSCNRKRGPAKNRNNLEEADKFFKDYMDNVRSG